MGFGDPPSAALLDGVGREVLDVLPQGVVIVDGRHLARYANQLARRLLGEGLEFGAVVPWVAGGLGCETVAGKEGELRVTGTALDGLAGWELGVLTAVPHRGGPGEDRRAIVHLAEVEAIARLGSWSWDIDADRVTLSDELLRMYGLAAQPNPMSYEAFLHAAPSAVRDQIAQTFARCRQTGEGYAFTTRLVGVDGQVRGRYSRANTVTSGGRVVRMFGTIQDISERLRAEEALSVSLDQARRLASENERLRTELETQLDEARASRARIVEAGDVARRELERDLHDTVQRRLAGVGLLLRSAEAQLGASVGSELGQTLGKALQELEAGLGELRTLARGLHPAILTDQGLMAALGALARRSAVPVKLRVAPLGVLPAGVETAAYFVVAEALTNVVKHAAASQVQVAIERSGATLLIEVADDGRGGATVSPGGGLGGLSDRVAALGGRLRLESSLRAGTLLQAELPCGESS